MNSLSKRVDEYTRSEFADPLAVGLLHELQAHLRASNKGAELNSHVIQNFITKLNDLEPRIQKLEQLITDK